MTEEEKKKLKEEDLARVRDTIKNDEMLSVFSPEVHSMAMEVLDERCDISSVQDFMIAALMSDFFMLQSVVDVEIKGIEKKKELPEDYKNGLVNIFQLFRLYSREKLKEQAPQLEHCETEDQREELRNFQFGLIKPFLEDVNQRYKLVLGVMPSTKPKSNIFLNDLISKYMFRNELPLNKESKVEVRKPSPNKPGQYVITSIELDPDIVLTNTDFTPYEQLVSDTVMSLYQEAVDNKKDPVFSLDTIYRAMPGSGEKASPAQREKLTAALKKLSLIRIKIDATSYFRKIKFLKKDETFREEAPYISLRYGEKTTENGAKKIEAYEIQAEPPILRYAKITGQIVTVPAALLAVKKIKGGKITKAPLVMTAERQTILSYMIKRIGVMKHAKKNGDTSIKQNILFKTLFEATGTDTENRVMKRRYREFCFAVLDFWTKEGYISGYSKQIEGREIVGINIELIEYNKRKKSLPAQKG